MPVKLDYSWFVDKTDRPLPVDQSNQMASSGVRNRIRVWCKGLMVDANIRVTQYVPEANTTWRVGFVQVLRYSKMKAHYGNGITEWTQQTLPCYDSTNAPIIPWYTVGTRVNIGAVNQQINLNFQDFPTSHIDPYYWRLGNANHNNALTHYIKDNKFDLYLMLRKEGVGGVHTDKILRHLSWRTKVEIEPIPTQWPAHIHHAAGYRLRKHNRSVSIFHTTLTISPSHLPPAINGSANDHINENRRNAHHGFWFHH